MVSAEKSNNRSEANLSLVLSDGREAWGYYTAAGSAISRVGTWYMDGENPLPESARIAAEAHALVAPGEEVEEGGGPWMTSISRACPTTNSSGWSGRPSRRRSAGTRGWPRPPGRPSWTNTRRPRSPGTRPETEARIARARQREQVAAEARARVRAENAERDALAEADRRAAIAEAEAREKQAREAADREARAAKARGEVAAAERRAALHRDLLLAASALVDLPPGNLAISTHKGQAFINQGEDIYDRDHLVTFRAGVVSTRRALIGRKPAITELCVRILAEIGPDAGFPGSIYFPRIKQQEGASS